MTQRCPCGTGLTYGECCGRLHDGTAAAGTAEQLMRSRYSAFVVGDAAYLLATWHPDTRPPSLDLDGDTRWLGLDVLAVEGGGLLAAEGTVEFRASYRADGGGTPSTSTAGSPRWPVAGTTWTGSRWADRSAPLSRGAAGPAARRPGPPPRRARRRRCRRRPRPTR
ncbi:YchJ family metal-binding protein [Klenkia terrae]|uniref:YchJ family protein n=1 Tax=Klenkia terrae TaxID=1052259 RepID=UPI0036211D2F